MVETDQRLIVNSVTVSDNKNATIWESNLRQTSDGELNLTLPNDIMKKEIVHRLINFTATKPIACLRLHEEVLFKGRLLEKWEFEYGAVDPNTVNTWMLEVQAAPETQVMPLSVLSGKTVIKSQFFDGDEELLQFVHKVHYI